MNSFFDAIRRIGFRRGPQRLLGGIAGGIAEGLGINVWLARLLVLLSFLLPVVGVGLYVLVWILTPWQDGSIPLERALSSGTERP
ncbi:PspC domain-containing protein [Nesterenkonia ebinurensis]|uniref:PspC domain-containing protein n=1 Tax=Nesterenkonia ebinurensis TaxID=2608252 RepID=UPI00123CB470|nr:PspC domain-containing protein [Nesterenkonia ebinurensis]